MMTPSEVSAKLNIQPSTLRKYSALLEQEGIQFRRTHKNALLYTNSECIAIESIIAAATLNEVKLAENPTAATRRAPKRTGYHVCGSSRENAEDNRTDGRATEAITCTSIGGTQFRSIRIVLTAGKSHNRYRMIPEAYGTGFGTNKLVVDDVLKSRK